MDDMQHPTSGSTVTLPLVSIIDPPDPTREVRPDAVDALATSLARLGLRTPITVRPIEPVQDGVPITRFEIIAGRHRVAAARSLGWTEIPAVVRDGDPIEARLWAIGENLARLELTALEKRTRRRMGATDAAAGFGPSDRNPVWRPTRCRFGRSPRTRNQRARRAPGRSS